jgi:hypothetical protein
LKPIVWLVAMFPNDVADWQLRFIVTVLVDAAADVAITGTSSAPTTNATEPAATPRMPRMFLPGPGLSLENGVLQSSGVLRAVSCQNLEEVRQRSIPAEPRRSAEIACSWCLQTFPCIGK